jgi:hypothetical protein
MVHLLRSDVILQGKSNEQKNLAPSLRNLYRRRIENYNW